MKVIQTDFFGDHNIGIFGKSSDELCLLGKALEGRREEIEDVLKVKSVVLTISDTDLIGIFCVLNKNGIILPKLITEKEKRIFLELKKLFGLNLLVLNSKFTAIGNLILCNDKGALISELFTRKEKKAVEDVLGVETQFLKIARIKSLGSCGIATNRGCLIHRDAKEEEIKVVEEVLKVHVDIGTLNFGSPFVGSCCIANSKGALVGKRTTGPEIARFQEALGFL